MEIFRSLVCYLVPGMLLGFGLAVLPRRELMGRSVSPQRGLRSKQKGGL